MVNDREASDRPKQLKIDQIFYWGWVTGGQLHIHSYVVQKQCYTSSSCPKHPKNPWPARPYSLYPPLPTARWVLVAGSKNGIPRIPKRPHWKRNHWFLVESLWSVGGQDQCWLILATPMKGFSGQNTSVLFCIMFYGVIEDENKWRPMK